MTTQSKVLWIGGVVVAGFAGVSPVALGLKNAQWTALAILLVAIPLLVTKLMRNGKNVQVA